MKHVQIPELLFRQLVLYHLFGECTFAKEIYTGINQKMDAIARRTYYTASKIAPTPAEREAARQAYLNEIGLRDSFRYQPSL